MTTQNLAKDITCPKCGTSIPIAMSRLGRKRLDIPFKNVCEALCVYQDIARAAEKLGCSVGFIYNACKDHGTKPKDVMEARSNRTGLDQAGPG